MWVAGRRVARAGGRKRRSFGRPTAHSRVCPGETMSAAVQRVSTFIQVTGGPSVTLHFRVVGRVDSRALAVRHVHHLLGLLLLGRAASEAVHTALVLGRGHAGALAAVSAVVVPLSVVALLWNGGVDGELLGLLKHAMGKRACSARAVQRGGCQQDASVPPDSQPSLSPLCWAVPRPHRTSGLKSHHPSPAHSALQPPSTCTARHAAAARSSSWTIENLPSFRVIL